MQMTLRAEATVLTTLQLHSDRLILTFKKLFQSKVITGFGETSTVMFTRTFHGQRHLCVIYSIVKYQLLVAPTRLTLVKSPTGVQQLQCASSPNMSLGTNKSLPTPIQLRTVSIFTALIRERMATYLPETISR